MFKYFNAFDCSVYPNNTFLLRETNFAYIPSSILNQSAKDQYSCQPPSSQNDGSKFLTVGEEMKNIQKSMSQSQISHQSSLLERSKTEVLDKHIQQNINANILKSSR